MRMELLLKNEGFLIRYRDIPFAGSALRTTACNRICVGGPKHAFVTVTGLVPVSINRPAVFSGSAHDQRVFLAQFLSLFIPKNDPDD